MNFKFLSSGASGEETIVEVFGANMRVKLLSAHFSNCNIDASKEGK